MDDTTVEKLHTELDNFMKSLRNTFTPLRLLWLSPDAEVDVMPSTILSAIGQILYGTIALCSFVTYLVDPDYVMDNPIRRMVGYNNACVAWDKAPALYGAAFTFVLLNALSVRYSQLDTKRIWMVKQLTTNERRVLTAINLYYMLAQVGNMGIFVITPMDGTLNSMWIHSFCFVQLMPSIAIMLASNFYVEHRGGVKCSALQIFLLCLFLFWSFLFAIMASCAVFLYKNDGVPVIPTNRMRFVDWGWFILLPVTASVMPDTTKIKLTFSVISPVPTTEP